MIRVRAESANFTFEAFGETAEEARATLVRVFEKHARDYELELDWWVSYFGDDGIVEMRVLPGMGLIDGEVV